MTPTEVKDRLEQAGYAIQRLPSDGPREYGTNWPGVPRTSLEAWILQLEAEADPEKKSALQKEAHRIILNASRDQMDALDDAIDWLLFLGNIPVRRMVWLRMFRHPVSERYRYSWKYISGIYGYKVRRCRDLHDTGIETICRNLKQAA